MRSSLATALRRVGEPRRRRVAAGGLLLGSLGLLGGVWLVLPADDPPVATTDEAPAQSASSALLSGPSRLVLPLPGDDPVRVETTLRHRRTGVEVLDATVVNNPDLAVELTPQEGGTTRLAVTSTAIHHCDRYAGSVVVTSRHPDERRDHLFIDVRFADCEGVSAVPAAPSSVHDTSRTWGDEGRAPWVQRRPTSPERRAEPDPPEDSSTPTPEPEPTTEPTQSSSPTPQPTDEPSQEPEPTGEPEPTQEPEPTEEPSDDSGDTDGEDTTADGTQDGADAGSSSDTTDGTESS